MDVPSAHRYGFRLDLDSGEMRRVLNAGPVRNFVSETADAVRAKIVAYVQSVATSQNAANYVNSLYMEDTFSDEYGFDFGEPWGLGNRPMAVIGVPAGRGVDPTAKPPLMVEAERHALTSVLGVTVGDMGEDVR